MFVYAPLLGWLADSRFGNFKVFKFGDTILFISVLMSSISEILSLGNIPLWSFVLIKVIASITSSLGFTSCIVAALQLGLDQMPDASSSNIASFVNWFAFSVCFGVWTCDSLWLILDECVNEFNDENGLILPLFSLFPVICMSI